MAKYKENWLQRHPKILMGAGVATGIAVGADMGLIASGGNPLGAVAGAGIAAGVLGGNIIAGKRELKRMMAQDQARMKKLMRQ